MIPVMLRRVAPFALAALLSCQDYRFNPVGRCLIQPGQVRVPVSSISTADILFVVDDSFSMHPIQASLASNFGSFIQQLAQTQADRVSTGKPALDFYIAVTTSAVLVNRATSAHCTGGTCTISNPTCPTPTTCPPAYSYACTDSGAVCGDVVTQYFSNFASCTPGVAVAAGDPFPDGSFVALGSNPKVLEFTKGLNWAAGTSDPVIQGLMNQFGQNIQVGDCSANQEMHFQGGRRALQKALAGQQALPAGVSWPHPESKLVVVWVGNEDDCSTRAASDPVNGLVWDNGGPGSDSCVDEEGKPLAQQKLTPVTDYATFFGSLGRPFGAAFIYGGLANASGFVPGDCGCSGGSCAAYGPGARFHGLADAFRGQGSTVVEASVCGDFADSLKQIADLVKPPEGLKLPTQPAADVVTQLRLQGADGKTDYVCSPPSTGGDWWFVDCGLGTPMPAGATSPCIALAPGGACVPGAGQTLVAEYLGRVPSGGCPVGTAGAPSAECATALGGVDADWTCDGAAGQTGTCLCRTGP
jgi:hypothetical protein